MEVCSLNTTNHKITGAVGIPQQEVHVQYILDNVGPVCCW